MFRLRTTKRPISNTFSIFLPLDLSVYQYFIQCNLFGITLVLWDRANNEDKIKFETSQLIFRNITINYYEKDINRRYTFINSYRQHIRQRSTKSIF